MKYEYQGKVYKFVSEGKVQIGQTWVGCVIYTNYSGRLYFCREAVDFYAKFKSVRS